MALVTLYFSSDNKSYVNLEMSGNAEELMKQFVEDKADFLYKVLTENTGGDDADGLNDSIIVGGIYE